jgi:hypothetical protein
LPIYETAFQWSEGDEPYLKGEKRLKIGDLSSRSPLKAAALSNPGESIGTEIHRLISEDLSTYILAFCMFLVLALMEWMRYLRNWPPVPKSMTFTALLVCGYASVKIVRIRRQLRMLRQGMQGEKAVGQYLERLRERGYQVLHDIPGENFNIDHVLIGQEGIYVIETKTMSKPRSGKAVIEYDGEQVKVNGFTPDHNPVTQARALTKWIKRLIKESTGRDFPVRAVVLYPGWYVTPQPRGAEVWVLNPKGLPTFLDHAKGCVTPEDVHLVSCHLCRYVRNRNAKPKAA